MLQFFRREPLCHYPMDRFSIISPILYRPEHRVVHVGGGPGRNHAQEINLNIAPMMNVDVVGDAEHLPFGDSSVDVVISNAVLEHVRNLEAAVHEIERIVKPGGFIYVEIPFIQQYHTHDGYGTRFEDYRRLTKTGLVEALRFCTPLDVGVCVGPASAVCQIVFSFLRGFSGRPAFARTVDRIYYFIGNLFVWIDSRLSDATIERSAIPSGIYFFGRKRDARSTWLEGLSRPNSAFPRDAKATIALVRNTTAEIALRITNMGRTTWLCRSKLDWGVVKVGLQQIHKDHIDRDFRRFDLPRDIAPGEAFELTIDRALLGDVEAARIDLVIEGICWFAERGSQPLEVALDYP